MEQTRKVCLLVVAAFLSLLFCPMQIVSAEETCSEFSVGNSLGTEITNVCLYSYFSQADKSLEYRIEPQDNTPVELNSIVLVNGKKVHEGLLVYPSENCNKLYLEKDLKVGENIIEIKVSPVNAPGEYCAENTLEVVIKEDPFVDFVLSASSEGAVIYTSMTGPEGYTVLFSVVVTDSDGHILYDDFIGEVSSFQINNLPYGCTEVTVCVLPVGIEDEDLSNNVVNLVLEKGVVDLAVYDFKHKTPEDGYKDPEIGDHFGGEIYVENKGNATFEGEAEWWISSDRNFADTLPSNKNNIISMTGHLRIEPGQTVVVAIYNGRPWTELTEAGEYTLHYGVKTFGADEENIDNNEGTFTFVIAATDISISDSWIEKDNGKKTVHFLISGDSPLAKDVTIKICDKQERTIHEEKVEEMNLPFEFSSPELKGNLNGAKIEVSIPGEKNMEGNVIIL